MCSGNYINKPIIKTFLYAEAWLSFIRSPLYFATLIWLGYTFISGRCFQHFYLLISLINANTGTTEGCSPDYTNVIRMFTPISRFRNIKNIGNSKTLKIF